MKRKQSRKQSRRQSRRQSRIQRIKKSKQKRSKRNFTIAKKSHKMGGGVRFCFRRRRRGHNIYEDDEDDEAEGGETERLLASEEVREDDEGSETETSEEVCEDDEAIISNSQIDPRLSSSLETIQRASMTIADDRARKNFEDKWIGRAVDEREAERIAAAEREAERIAAAEREAERIAAEEREAERIAAAEREAEQIRAQELLRAQEERIRAEKKERWLDQDWILRMERCKENAERRERILRRTRTGSAWASRRDRDPHEEAIPGSIIEAWHLRERDWRITPRPLPYAHPSFGTATDESLTESIHVPTPIATPQEGYRIRGNANF